MQVIWKYPLQLIGLQTIEMPLGAEILHVAVQHQTPCLWVMIPDTTMVPVSRRIEIAGTGEHLSDRPRKYLGTVLMDAFVWHIFERTEF